MKKDISFWQFAGFAFTSLSGTILHFLYEWTNQNIFTAPFSGVNESTWEHMKLLYFPMLITALIQSLIFKEYKNFWCIKLLGTVSGLILIPVIFYTYNGAFGKSPDWFNISIFFISAAISFILETKLFKSEKVGCKCSKAAISLMVVLGLSFIIFTFRTPQIPLFKDPVTGLYGINN